LIRNHTIQLVNFRLFGRSPRKALQAGSVSSGMDGEGVGVGIGLVDGEVEMQAAAILIESDPACADQVHALDWPREGG